MGQPFYHLGQQHATTRYGVKVASRAADVAGLELAARDLLSLGQSLGLGKGPLPIPTGAGAGLAGALETDGHPLIHGLSTGLGAHYGGRAGHYTGDFLGALLGAGINALPLPSGAQGTQAAVARFLPRAGGALGEYFGARSGADLGHGAAALLDRKE